MGVAISGIITEAGFMPRLERLLDTYDSAADDAITRLALRSTTTMRRRRAAVDPRRNDDRDLVGMEQARVDLIRLLDLDQPRKSVVSVLGSAGLGKTRSVYATIQARFDCCALVCMGPHPMMDHVFKSILHSLDGAKYSGRLFWDDTMDERELVKEIRRFLHNKILVGRPRQVWQPIGRGAWQYDIGEMWWWLAASYHRYG